MGLPKIAVPEYNLTLPSNGKEIKYRPFLVKEEKILLIAMESEDEKQIMEATKSVIKNCVFGEIEVEKMATIDIEYLFLWLRGKSKGEQIELKYNCPKCETPVPLVFDIEAVKVSKGKDHTNKIQLTDTIGVVLKYPSLGMQVELDKIDNEVVKIFKSITSCIDYIYDNETMYSTKDHTENDIQEFIDSLNDSQFEKLVSFFDTMPKLKHDVEFKCKNKKNKKVCNHEETIVLEGIQSFFA